MVYKWLLVLGVDKHPTRLSQPLPIGDSGVSPEEVMQSLGHCAPEYRTGGWARRKGNGPRTKKAASICVDMSYMICHYNI